jgi:hypothetical protein
MCWRQEEPSIGDPKAKGRFRVYLRWLSLQEGCERNQEIVLKPRQGIDSFVEKW